MAITHDPPERCLPAAETTARECGILSLRSGDLPSALEHLREAVRADPEDVEAYAYLGVAYGRLEMLPEAVDCLTDAVRLAPGSAPLRYNLGRALEQLGKPGEARAAYEEALALDAGYERARGALLRLADSPVESPQPEFPALPAELEATQPCERVSAELVESQDAAVEPEPKEAEPPHPQMRERETAAPGKFRTPTAGDRRRSRALLGFSVFIIIWGVGLGVLCWALWQPETSHFPVPAVASTSPAARPETPPAANAPQAATEPEPAAVSSRSLPETGAAGRSTPAQSGTAPQTPAAGYAPASASKPAAPGGREAKLRFTILRADALAQGYKQRAATYREEAAQEAKSRGLPLPEQASSSQIAEYLEAQGEKARGYGDQARYELAEALLKQARKEEALPLFQSVADSEAAAAPLRERSNQRLQQLLHE